jgi:hypothetical protein
MYGRSASVDPELFARNSAETNPAREHRLRSVSGHGVLLLCVGVVDVVRFGVVVDDVVLLRLVAGIVVRDRGRDVSDRVVRVVVDGEQRCSLERGF